MIRPSASYSSSHTFRPQPGASTGRYAVVMEQIPFAFVFRNGVMGGPTYDRGKDDTLIGERAIWVVADGITQAVGVSGGVGEVVFSVILVHPGGFEEAAVVISGSQWLAVLVQDDYGFGFFGKLQHVRIEFGNACGDGRFIVCGESSTAFQSLVVTVTLQLSAPEAAEVHVIVTVTVIQYGGVYAVTTAHRVGLRDEWSFGTVADGNTDTEDVVLVFQGEVHIVFSVFLGYIAVPELASRPGDVFGGEHEAVVGDFSVHRVVGGEDVIVFHVEVVAVVIFGDAAFPVVRRVDVKAVVEYVNGGVCHIIFGY